MKTLLLAWLAVLAIGPTLSTAAAPSGSQVIGTELVSQALQGNRIGIDPKRTVMVYLPRGYDRSTQAYPVIYHFHSIFWSSPQMFEPDGAQAVFDRAVTSGTIGDFILVAADFTTPHVGTFYGNSETTGRWLDFISDELVPFIDRTYRTLPTRESRGLSGDLLGGHAALKLAMLHPEQFSAVYALHPVGTGKGLVPLATRVDWRKINRAKSWADLEGDVFAQVFVTMAQAYLPNPDRPPFYCDFIFELKEDTLVLNPRHEEQLVSTFFLDQLLKQHADALRQMSGIAFDWGRYDPNQDHVYANQSFTRELDLAGIEHFAEEYRGAAYDKNWIAHGRVEDRLLPFFGRHLKFAPTSREAGHHQDAGNAWVDKCVPGVASTHPALPTCGRSAGRGGPAF
ncbi:alpha/beta hydrolase [Povalibacter sp.]|uniref:alpha/beta hydrolase n=1 Tax=Povalibacter sp. TaxID=1962978 RepID=UPI002F3E9A39